MAKRIRNLHQLHRYPAKHRAKRSFYDRATEILSDVIEAVVDIFLAREVAK